MPSRRIFIDPILAEIVPGFLESRRLEIPALRAWLASGDHVSIAATGHKIAGSGASYGFEEMTEIGRSLEAAALAKDMQHAGKTIDALDEYLSSLELVPARAA